MHRMEIEINLPQQNDAHWQVQSYCQIKKIMSPIVDVIVIQINLKGTR